MDKVQVDQAGEEHAKATVSSGTRGRPLVELIKKLEARNPELVKAHGIYSVEFRRLEAEAGIRRAEAAIGIHPQHPRRSGRHEPRRALALAVRAGGRGRDCWASIFLPT